MGVIWRGLLRRIFGGRPMHRVAFCFTDMVSGQPVYLWRDQFHRDWYATGRWARFRVKPEHSPEIWGVTAGKEGG